MFRISAAMSLATLAAPARNANAMRPDSLASWFGSLICGGGYFAFSTAANRSNSSISKSPHFVPVMAFPSQVVPKLIRRSQHRASNRRARGRHAVCVGASCRPPGQVPGEVVPSLAWSNHVERRERHLGRNLEPPRKARVVPQLVGPELVAPQDRIQHDLTVTDRNVPIRATYERNTHFTERIETVACCVFLCEIDLVSSHVFQPVLSERSREIPTLSQCCRHLAPVEAPH